MRQKMKGVIITVYEESPASTTTTTTTARLRLRLRRRQKRSKPISSAHGYDRRAHLLAYARDLRKGRANSGPTSSPKSWPKPKISRFPASIRRLFQRQYRYERIVPEEVTTRNKEKTRIDVKLCKKLRAVLKQFSSGWRCNRR